MPSPTVCPTNTPIYIRPWVPEYCHSGDSRARFFRILVPSVLLLQNYAHILHRKADSSTDVEFKEEQRLQLDRTLHSLINLSLHEGRVRRMTICAQTAISYSALMILHSPSFLESDISVQPITMEMRINLEKRKAPVSWSTTLNASNSCHSFTQITLPSYSCSCMSFHLPLYVVLVFLQCSCSGHSHSQPFTGDVG